MSTIASLFPEGASLPDFLASANPRPALDYVDPIIYCLSCFCVRFWQPSALYAACEFASSLRAHHRTIGISSSTASIHPHESISASLSASPTWLHRSYSFQIGLPRYSLNLDNHASSSN